ncbi:MAG: hypothetical protein AB8C84_13385 [Oligoflexales bacterium]
MIPKRHFYDEKSQSTLRFIERWSQEVEGDTSLLLLDIDSTLIDTSYRTAAIFKSFAEKKIHLQRYPEFCRLIALWEKNLYEVYDPIEFINTHTPSLYLTETLKKNLYDYWYQRFFHPTWLSYDHAFSGAATFAQNVAKHVHIGYLTGRCEPTLRDATKTQLQTFQFPFTKDELLFMKPEKDIADLQFKSEGLKYFTNNFHNIIYIDNEIELVEMSLSHFPNVETILFQSIHSGRGTLTHQPKTLSSWVTSCSTP